MGKPMSIPMNVGGQWSSGDAGSQPDGTARLLQNILPRPNRFPSRPPFTYDSLMGINGLVNFDDLTNDATRLLAIDTTQHLYVKSTSGETWSSANVTTVAGHRVTNSDNYRGVAYMMLDDGAGLPSASASFDGTNVNTQPFTSPIAARTLTIYRDRAYLSYPRVTVTNLLSSLTTATAYDWTRAGCIPTNVTVTNITNGTETVCRLFPTSTGAEACSLYWKNAFGAVVPDATGLVAVPASTANLPYVYRLDIRPVDAVNTVPLTIEVVVVAGYTQILPQPYAAGALLDRNGYLFRCTTAGTASGAEPAWTATGGATSTWGTATFTNIGSATVGSLPITLPNASDVRTWIAYAVPASVPWGTNGCQLTFRLKFWNIATDNLTVLSPIDVSRKDGLSDGDPRKQNYGQQCTSGDFYFPFFNQESSNVAVVDMAEEVWSEIGTVNVIRAANTYKLREAPGNPTAACVIGNRKLTFKRPAFWQFSFTDDPDNPIRVERLNTAVGCIGPLAIDVWNDTAFFIGEYEIYSYTVGGEPNPLCGDGMRERIMARGSNWVESQSTYNRPILRIDQSKLIVWVYTQKGKLYAYDLRTQSWSTHIVNDGTVEVDCIEWNRNTGNMYVGFGGHGLTRMDYTSIARDVIDNTSAQYDVDCTVVFKPIELYSPPRYDYALQQIRFMHAATEDQTGQTTTAAYSFDQGKTFVKSSTVTLSPLSSNGEFVPFRYPARQGRATITVKLSHVGKTGEVLNSDDTSQSAWSLSSRSYADVIVRREERTQSNPTQGASNL